MLRPVVCGSILCTLGLIMVLPAAGFEEPAVHPRGSVAHARDPAQARCPGWDDESEARQGRGEHPGDALLELTHAVAKDPTDAAACRRLAAALRAVGRNEEAQRLEDQAAHVTGFCLVRDRKGT